MYCKLRRLDLLRSGKMSDCELHVSYVDKYKRCSCREFRCHKIILASASEQFEQMINSPEFQQDKSVMYVNDASPEAYETMLLYIYTYEIYNAINVDMCVQLVHLANKYKLNDFAECYINKLMNQHWPMDLVLEVFHLANESNNPKMLSLVSEKLVPIATQVLNDNSFLKLNVRELKSLMVILRAVKTIPDRELLLALKKYQSYNNLRYENMVCFRQFVEVANLFGETLFGTDGTLSIDGKDTDNASP
ncbi:CG14260, partial [Drosophila busckii]